MRSLVLTLALLCAAVPAPHAQTKKAPPKKAAPAPKKAPEPAVTRLQAELTCPSELGVGVRTKRRFCDVLAGRDPAIGVLVEIPPHRGPVTLSFELHNRHTYSEDLVKTKKAFRQYTATIGVLTMDNTLIDRAVIQSEFRSEADLFDRIAGGVGPGGVKAVAPSGTEFIIDRIAPGRRRAGDHPRREAVGAHARGHRYLRLRGPADRHDQQRDGRIPSGAAAQERRPSLPPRPTSSSSLESFQGGGEVESLRLWKPR